MAPPRSTLGAELYVSPRALTRLRHLTERVEYAAPAHVRGPQWLFQGVEWHLRGVGIAPRDSSVLDTNDIFDLRGAVVRDGSWVSLFLASVWHVLRNQVDERGTTQFTSPSDYERDLNQILADEGAPFRLRAGAWTAAAATDAELLRRILLESNDDVAGCRQGDVQVEMVASTVQSKLSTAGAVVVDYGAGVGRVLAGLATATNFKTAHYVAVDEPMPAEVRRLAGSTGAQATFIDDRSAFLAGDTTADVIMVVNTLHHVPFADVGRQIAGLLAKLRPQGLLLVHEMGMLRAPEQRNVPWRCEDLVRLFNGDEFTCNARSSLSRTGVPLAHVLVAPTGRGSAESALRRNVEAVWSQMKTRVLDEITTLYQSRDPERHAELQHALITNANLDLNRPEM